MTPSSVTSLCVVIGALVTPYTEVPDGVYKVAPGGSTCVSGCIWLDATGRAVTPRCVTVLCVVIGALVNP